MTSQTIDMPVGQLVAENWGRAKVLEAHQIDYCCGGGISLAEACRQRALDAQAVLAELIAADTQGLDNLNIPTGSINELIGHLVQTHHRFLRDELPRLAQLVTRVAGVHGSNHPELIAVAEVFEHFRSDMLPHLDKEEQILFPMCRTLETAPNELTAPPAFIKQPIMVMASEHVSAGDDLKRLRELTNGYAVPADACGSYRAMMFGLEQLEQDTLQHVHKENNILFPAVRDLVDKRS